MLIRIAMGPDPVVSAIAYFLIVTIVVLLISYLVEWFESME